MRTFAVVVCLAKSVTRGASHTTASRQLRPRRMAVETSLVHTQPRAESYQAAKKPSCDPSLCKSIWASPSAERKCGDEGEEHRLHRRFDTQRLSSKKTARMGDKAKPLASPGRRLCCV